MITLPSYLSNTISMCIGFFIAGILFNTIKKKPVKKEHKHNYNNNEQSLSAIIQHLKKESDLRQNIEEKLHQTLKKSYELQSKLSIVEERLKLLNHSHQKCEQLSQELNAQYNINNTQALKLKELNITLNTYKTSTEEKIQLFIKNEQKLTMQLENLANRILEQYENKINQQNRLTLNNILHPFQEQLNEFKNQIQYNFSEEKKLTHNLTYEIHHLHQLNTKITQETINLTQALKGNNKIQGNWGELILTRALEDSGMREGHEFYLQKNIEQSDGNKLQPDVIIHLPYDKKVIIDSKVSLLAYERYFNSKNEKDKQSAIIEHIHSLRVHITSLNKKDYRKIFGLDSLDYILMFIPIESAFILAIQKDISLLTEAMKNNIMLVSPTTLLIALRTINNLWCYEYQNHHAKKIAEKAGKLYDKLRLFTEDLNKIGQYLNKVGVIYNTAKNKFSEGKGNIISQVEKFRELGVQVKQPINIDETTNFSTIFNKQTK